MEKKCLAFNDCDKQVISDMKSQMDKSALVGMIQSNIRLNPYTYGSICEICAEILNVMWRNGTSELKVHTPFMEITFKKRD